MAKAADAKTKVKGELDPKWGARASRRLEDVKKEKGAQKAKTVETKAREIALKNSDKTIRLEYVYEAEGVKMPEGARSHYGKSNGTDKPPSSRKSSTAKPAAKKTAATKKATGAGRDGRGNRRAAKVRKTANAASSRSHTKTTETGSGSSTSSSRSDQMRELREKQAEERGQPITPETLKKMGVKPQADPGIEVGGTSNHPPTDEENPTTLA